MLDRAYQAWQPAAGERWEAFVRRKAPPEPSWLHPIDRARHREALAAALDAGETRRTLRALLLPFWVGNNEDEEPRGDVWERTLLLEAPAQLREVQLRADDGTFWARVELAALGGSHVGLGYHYAPGMPVRRIGPFVVVESVSRTVVEQVEACELVPATPAPTRMVPAFSALLEPAFDVSMAPTDVGAAVDAAVARLQFVNEDEEGEARGSG